MEVFLQCMNLQNRRHTQNMMHAFMIICNARFCLLQQRVAGFMFAFYEPYLSDHNLQDVN